MSSKQSSRHCDDLNLAVACPPSIISQLSRLFLCLRPPPSREGSANYLSFSSDSSNPNGYIIILYIRLGPSRCRRRVSGGFLKHKENQEGFHLLAAFVASPHTGRRDCGTSIVPSLAWSIRFCSKAVELAPSIDFFISFRQLTSFIGAKKPWPGLRINTCSFSINISNPNSIF
jgi:hypothetical protein